MVAQVSQRNIDRCRKDKKAVRHHSGAALHCSEVGREHRRKDESDG